MDEKSLEKLGHTDPIAGIINVKEKLSEFESEVDKSEIALRKIEGIESYIKNLDPSDPNTSGDTKDLVLETIEKAKKLLKTYKIEEEGFKAWMSGEGD